MRTGGTLRSIATLGLVAVASLALLAAILLDTRRAYVHEAALNRAVDVAGACVAIASVIAVALGSWWLQTHALEPLANLARAMARFGGGDVDQRAAVEGPAELAAMARTFNEMAESVSRQRKQRQTFIAGVAHDLRSPLGVLRMSTDLARMSDEKLPPIVIDAVRRQVDRLERMVGDLLDSLNVEAGNLQLRMESVDVREIAAETARAHQGVSSRHVVELDVPATQVPLVCDGMRVGQILSNLVGNAIKYSPRGGRVTIRVTSEDDAVVLCVSDEGVGMTPEETRGVFEPFRRGGTLRDGVPGWGLGLFVVRRLVDAHGGQIQLLTAPDRGSTFRVSLPYHHA
ncbi:MAG: HAMP domain-containing histidine kinase [Labilithrix sp.]|nr:HAMP domain-containing histidine kinase [Labilithrix sp.]